MAFADQWTKLKDTFSALKSAPRELWLVYFLKFLESYAYFSMCYVLVIYLSDEFDYSDQDAGWAYGAIGMLTSVYGLMIGFFVDMAGVKLTLVIGSLILVAARVMLAVTHDKLVLALMLFGLFPLGSAMTFPVMTIGVKRYTNINNRGVAFNLYYVVMNIAALLAGPAVDVFRSSFEGTSVGSYRSLIFSGAICSGIEFIVALLLVREIDVSDTGEEEEFVPKDDSPLVILKDVVGNSRFWRFVLFTVLLCGVRLVYRHLDATFPKYMMREFGADAPYGKILSINPFIVIFLVPLLGAFTNHIPAFDMILAGSFVSAGSVFFMVIGSDYWEVICFIVVLSIGESMWSPRAYEYTMMVAPKGREGTYGALSFAPMFVATILTGGLSGWLLAAYCPKHGHRSCETMWLIIGVMATTSPVFMFLLRSVIRLDDNGEYEVPKDTSIDEGAGEGESAKDRERATTDASTAAPPPDAAAGEDAGLLSAAGADKSTPAM